MKFANQTEFLTRLRLDDACRLGYRWVLAQPDLDTCLREMRHEWRIWCLTHEYEQFAEHCEWRRLTGGKWSWLLRVRPELAEHCRCWDQLTWCDWAWLLRARPEFAIHCEWWDRLTGYGWAWLLRAQPELAEHCQWWYRLDGEDWAWLLAAKPELAKYRTETYMEPKLTEKFT